MYELYKKCQFDVFKYADKIKPLTIRAEWIGALKIERNWLATLIFRRLDVQRIPISQENIPRL